jgi:hypothetical protein
MSSKAGSSKRVGEDITKQAKKIKGIDVSLCIPAAAPAAAPAQPGTVSATSLSGGALPFRCLQEVLRLVKKLAEQSKKNTDKEK